MTDGKQKDCIFCNMDESRMIFQNDLFYAIRDGFPVTFLHTLLIPRRHVTSYFSLSSDEKSTLIETLDFLRGGILDSDASITGFNVGFNDGVSAGQTVMHCHVHIIPRREKDVSDPRGGVRGVIPDKQKYQTSLLS